MARFNSIESCIMQLGVWVGRGGRVAYAPPPHLHPSYWHLNIALSLIFIRFMLRLILTKCHVSTITTNKTLISFSISGKISRWKGGRANIPTPDIYDVSLLKNYITFLVSFYYPSATCNLVLSIGYDLYSYPSIIQYNGYM